MEDNKECSLIKDLLQTYIDNLTTEKTNEFINSHFSKCDKCLNEYNNTLKKMQDNNYKNEIKNIKYQVRLTLIICIGIGMLLSIIYMYCYYKENIIGGLNVIDIIPVMLIAIGLYFIPSFTLFVFILWKKTIVSEKKKLISNIFLMFFLSLIILQSIILIFRLYI